MHGLTGRTASFRLNNVPDCSRRIRALRAEYHPDRYVELGPQMAPIVAEVSAVVNTRTEPLLREDQAAAAVAGEQR